jgi:hypothetical protein
MIQHLWTLACRVSLVDQESNNVSLIQVLEELTIPTVAPQVFGPGMVLAMFDVVTLWGRENEEQGTQGRGRISIISPTGDELLAQEYEVDLREVRRARSVSRMLGFPAQGSGQYGFRIERRVAADGQWERVAVVPLWVNIQQHQAPARPPANDGPT